jgi:hypothetical protein
MAKASATAAVVVFPIIRMEFSPVMDMGAEHQRFRMSYPRASS